MRDSATGHPRNVTDPFFAGTVVFAMFSTHRLCLRSVRWRCIPKFPFVSLRAALDLNSCTAIWAQLNFKLGGRDVKIKLHILKVCVHRHKRAGLGTHDPYTDAQPDRQDDISRWGWLRSTRGHSHRAKILMCAMSLAGSARFPLITTAFAPRVLVGSRIRAAEGIYGVALESHSAMHRSVEVTANLHDPNGS